VKIIKCVEPVVGFDERVALLEALGKRHPKYAIMFVIGIETGLRISDILSLKAKQIKPKCAKGFIVIEKKTKKPRQITIQAKTIRNVREYVKVMRLQPEDYLVYSTDTKKDKPLSRVQAYRIISSTARLTGSYNVGTHSLRKTYAKTKYALKNDLNALQNDFGHLNINTTLAYLITREKLKEVISNG
jgi:integrase